MLAGAALQSLPSLRVGRESRRTNQLVRNGRALGYPASASKSRLRPGPRRPCFVFEFSPQAAASLLASYAVRYVLRPPALFLQLALLIMILIPVAPTDGKAFKVRARRA